MKTLLLIASLDVGGAERQLVTLAREMHRRGEDVCVTTFYSGGTLENFLSKAAVRVMSFDKKGRWDFFGFIGRAVRFVRNENPDVIYSFMPMANLTALLIGLFSGRPKIVWGVRSSYVDMSRYGLLNRLVYFLERACSRFSNLIIANSQAGREQCVSRGYPAARISVVSNGVDTQFFKPDVDGARRVRSELGILESQRVIGIVARLDPMKDHETFLAAAARVAQERDDLRFVCVGGGNLVTQKRLEALAEDLGVGGKVIWTGPRDDIPAVYSACDISTCSSYGEGFPNMVIEAMACATPCVVTNVGDSALIVGDSGIVVPPRDQEALAQGWLKLLCLDDERRHGLGQKARQRIEDHFSVAAMTDKTLQEFSDIVGAGQKIA